jgi:hypothetical protein
MRETGADFAFRSCDVCVCRRSAASQRGVTHLDDIEDVLAALLRGKDM